MMTHLEITCTLCGKDTTNMTIAQIQEHMKKDHNITILDAIYEYLRKEK